MFKIPSYSPKLNQIEHIFWYLICKNFEREKTLKSKSLKR